MSFPPGGPANYGGPPQGFPGPGPQGPTRGPQPHFPPPQFHGPPPGHFAGPGPVPHGPGGPGPGPYPNQFAPQPHYPPPPQHFQPQPHMQHPHPHAPHHTPPPQMMTPPPPQPAGVPYIGARISLISNMDIRYEGILYTIDAANSTVALQHVRCFGTEDRSPEFVPASNNIYEYIVFSGKDIKDLHVVTATTNQTQQPPHDPAIVSTQAPPKKEPTPAPAPAEKSDKAQAAPAPAPAPASAPAATTPAPAASAPPKSPKATPAPASASASASAPSTAANTNTNAAPATDKNSQKADDDIIHIKLPSKHDSTPGMGSYLRSRAGHKAVAEEEAYDFSKANQEFEKLRIKEQKKEDEPSGHASGGVAVDEGPSSDSMAQYELPVADDKPVIAQPKYDKSKSFFDDLTSDRDVDTSIDRRKQRGQDAETFGEAAYGYRSRGGTGGPRGGHGHGHGHGHGGYGHGGGHGGGHRGGYHQGGYHNNSRQGGDRGGNWRQGGSGGGDRRDNRDNSSRRDGGRDNYQRRDDRDSQPRERRDGAGAGPGQRGRGRRGGYQAGSATVSQ